jgi:hypothetical protein
VAGSIDPMLPAGSVCWFGVELADVAAAFCF